MIGYPNQLPTDAISTVVKIVTSGQLLTQKEEFALAAWNLQGYLQGVLLPAAGGVTVSAMAVNSTLDDEEAVEALNHLNAQLEKGDPTDVIAASIPVPVQILLKWLLSTLLPLLIS